MKQTKSQQKQKQQPAKKNGDLLLIIAVIACVAALIALGVVLAIKLTPKQVTVVEFTPPPFDESAEQGTPTVPAELGWSEMNAKDKFKVSICGIVRVIDGATDLYLTNPAENTVYLKVRVLNADGEIVGESGLVRPGEFVRSVAIEGELAVDEKVTLKVMAYEPDTYQSAGAVPMETKVYE